MGYRGLIEKYRKNLPVSDKTPVISLHEGNTPLLPARNLPDKLGFNGKIYLKFEGMNPTGSFKDRGMTMAVSKAVEDGSKIVICASTGNTSASAAAYAARAGIKCVVLIPEGKIALGKLSQAVMHGAEVLEIDGNFDEALNLVKELSSKYPLTLVNSINPFRIEGQKTAAYEICESLEQSPDYQFMPVGNAGNITAYWKGYKEYNKAAPEKYTLPKMMGFQAAGSAPIVEGHPITNPETIATAIRIGNPASWKTAEEARDESGGVIDKVTDEEILEAYRIVAVTEGVFCEPASASSIAGLIKYIKQGYFKSADPAKIVCILTGHGLKDPDTAVTNAVKPKKVKADIKDIINTIGF
ncbi:threonine synthase [Endomicrobiia bacterium]|uniref:threonine synthase n=1 Tax=Endomicrobium trichonymphae TaxID=1408204 RepID=UPI002219FF3F|nr:threonine synthase [Endomicrobiia bacterium]GMO51886.1 MAG: threonine synthase [Candidatus Endomicrobium trichonymphae]GHT07452.1 threonine synthase [Endomicrobiia bacterium]GHT19850.1 threonine synthase [Endomicrobiia bacterium]GHT26383.1 threonine synthase [Endomicrobiia bacterium]